MFGGVSVDECEGKTNLVCKTELMIAFSDDDSIFYACLFLWFPSVYIILCIKALQYLHWLLLRLLIVVVRARLT